MSAGAAILISAIFLGMDAIMIGAVFWILRDSIARPMSRLFPPQPARPDEVAREFQSFRIDFFSFGYSMHVAVDEQFLHLRPAALARLFGMTPLSIPWPSITLRPGRAKSKFMRADVRADGKSWSMLGPRWCLELATPPPA